MTLKTLLLSSFFIFFGSLGIAKNKTQPKSMASSLSAKSSASISFEALKPLLYQVKTSAGVTAEKSSYGTGFVVGLEGYLLTNYHVVADAVWNPKSNHVYAVINQENTPAQIIDIDVVHDLALIKVPHTFAQKITVSTSTPNPGADLHSLGLPEDLDWTVVNGVYNGLIRRGPYELIHLTTPLNPGMSGGPTVNTNAELVGINVSGLLYSQNISFAVPLKWALPLIQQAHGQEKIPPNPDELILKIDQQLKKVQIDLTELTLQALDTSKELDQWKVPKLSNQLKCWGQKSTENESKYTLQLERCEIEHRTQLTHEVSTAFLKIETTLIQNRGLNFFSYYHFLNSEWDNDEMDTGQIFSQKIKVNYGPYDCITNNLENAQIHVSICTRSLIPFTDLFEIHVKAIKKIGTEQALMSYMILDGFNKENFQKILKKYLQNFGGLKP